MRGRKPGPAKAELARPATTSPTVARIETVPSVGQRRERTNNDGRLAQTVSQGRGRGEEPEEPTSEWKGPDEAKELLSTSRENE